MQCILSGPTKLDILHQDSVPPNVDQLKSQAKKEYNYYYTGQNEDVLDFDIKFNTALLSKY